MRNTLLIFILLVFCPNLYSQGKIMGTVYYQNSGWKPVEGIAVNADGSNGDYSKTEGNYTLFFSTKNIGQVVRPYIGNRETAIDKYGVEMELVNEKELAYVVIPENPKKAPLHIIVAKKGSRDVVARKYYKIIKTDLEKKLDANRQELMAMRKKLGNANVLVKQKTKELQVFTTLADSLKIYKDALAFASINRDGASERTNSYLTALDAGISIGEARKELSSEQAFSEAEISIKNLSSSIEELNIIAEVAKTQLKFDEAFEQYNKIGNILENKLIDPLRRIENHLNSGFLAMDIHRYSIAISSFSNALKAEESVSSVNPERRSLLRYYLGRAYYFSKDFDMTKKVLSLSLKQNSEPEKDTGRLLLGKTLSLLGNVWMAENEYTIALTNFKAAVPVITRMVHTYPEEAGLEISEVFDRIGAIHLILKEYDQAEKAFNTGVETAKVLVGNSTGNYTARLADSYVALGTFHSMRENFENANSLFSKALPIYEGLVAENPQKYGLPFVESLTFLLATQWQLTILEEIPVQDFQKSELALEYIDQAENLLKIYDGSAARIKGLKKQIAAFSNYFGPLAPTSEQHLLTDDFNSESIYFAKRTASIEQKIEASDNYGYRLDQCLVLLNEIERFNQKFPDREAILAQLNVAYARIATEAIAAGRYDLAEETAGKLKVSDVAGVWQGYVNLVLVNAYVLQGRIQKAWPIYIKFRDSPFPNTNGKYRENFLADINDLESRGIHHKDFTKIKAFLKE